MWNERASKTFCFGIWALLFFIVMKYLLSTVIFLVVAVIFSSFVYWISKKLSHIIKIPRGILAAIILSVIFAALGAVVVFSVKRLISEMGRIVQNLSLGERGIEQMISDAIRKSPVLYGAVEKVSPFFDVESKIEGLIFVGGQKCAQILKTLISSIPEAFISTVIFVLICYYISIDFERVYGFVLTLLPPKMQKKNIRKSVFGIGIGYLRSQIILFVLTFFEVFAGLLIIYPSYACIGALIVATVDILPLFGAGTVLIPTAIFALLGGQYYVCIGLLILYLTVSVVRQFAEPHILGENLGIHPLASVLSMFVGYKFFGFGGMILMPVILSVWVSYKKIADSF